MFEPYKDASGRDCSAEFPSTDLCASQMLRWEHASSEAAAELCGVLQLHKAPGNFSSLGFHMYARRLASAFIGSHGHAFAALPRLAPTWLRRSLVGSWFVPSTSAPPAKPLPAVRMTMPYFTSWRERSRSACSESQCFRVASRLFCVRVNHDAQNCFHCINL